MLRIFKVMEGENDGKGGGAGGNPPAPAAGAPPAAPASVLGNTPPPPAPPAPGTPPKNSYDAKDWRHSLPDDIREESALRNMMDPAAAAKALIHAQRMVGYEKVAKPGPNASEEDWQKFFDSLGRPPLEQYEVKPPKDAKFINPEILAKLKPIAHRSGVTNKQLEKILEFYEGEVSQTDKAMGEAKTKKISEGIASLKAEWGMTYQQRADWAARLIKEDLGIEGVKFMNEHPEIGSHPLLIKYFAKLGEERYKEDRPVGEGGGAEVFSPAEATRRANEILANSDHAYNKPEHPNHKQAVEEVQNLWRMAYPDQRTG